MQEIAVIERLQAEELELQIAFRLQRGGEPGQIEARQFGIEEFGGDAFADEKRKIFGITRRHIGLRRVDRRAMHERQHFGAQLVEQQPGADVGVVRLLLHQRARRQDGCQRHFFQRRRRRGCAALPRARFWQRRRRVRHRRP